MARHGENIYKRKDGRYEGRYVTGRKANGKTKFGYVFGRQYTDVRVRLIEKKAEMLPRNESSQKPYSPTLAQWMLQWMESEVLGRVKPSSYQTYQNQLNRHLLPSLGNTRLNALTPWMVNAFVEELYAKGLADSTVRNVYRIFSAGIRSALEDGLVRKNPCRRIKVRRGDRKEPRVLSRKEQLTMEAALDGENCLAGWVGLYTGIRVGELCGLQWSDIDWQQGTITVRRTVQRLRKATSLEGKKTYLAIGSPKSYQSHRTIPVPTFLLEKLKRQRDTAQNHLHHEAFVFGFITRPAEPRTIQRRFQGVVKSLGMPGVHFHTLRHSYGTRLLELGVDVKTVSVLLGHDSAKTTLDCYAHSLMEQRQEAVRRLNTFAVVRS